MSEKRRDLLARIVAVAASVTIVFCACSLAAYAQGGDPFAFLSADAFQTVASDPQEEADNAESAGDATADEAASDDADAATPDADSQDEAPAEDASKESPSGAGQAPTDSGSSSSGGQKQDASSSGASASKPNSSSGATSDGSSPAAPATPAPDPDPAPAPEPEPEPDPQPATITVTVSIDGSAGGGASSSTTVTLSAGATVYDALLATGAGVNASGTAYGTYVSAINGLAEKEHGGQSGWKYSVNGVVPNKACSAYTLSGGESVRWYYVLSAND